MFTSWSSVYQFLASIGRVILNAAVLYLLTIIYLQLYKYTRQENKILSYPKSKRKRLEIFLFYTILSGIGTGSRVPLKYIIPILGITAGIDFIIQRIPTEFLVILLLISIQSNDKDTIWMRILISALVFILWSAFRKKLDMGFYDILLISILSLNLSGFPKILQFSSVILIIWGAAGLILQKVYGRKPGTKIPLAPLIASAFIFVTAIP